jgi:MFS family permease
MFSCLDTSIVSTALVSLSIEFENYEDAPWVILGYLLTYMSASGSFLRSSRRLTQSRLRHRLFQAERRVRTKEPPRGGLGHFLGLLHMVCAFALHGTTVGCRMAPQSESSTDALRRIAARSLQGIGGSGLYSLAQVCLVEQGPNRPEIVGALVGITLSISYILGPLLGGAISEWTWRGIFWIKYVSFHAAPS